MASPDFQISPVSFLFPHQWNSLVLLLVLTHCSSNPHISEGAELQSAFLCKVSFKAMLCTLRESKSTPMLTMPQSRTQPLLRPLHTASHGSHPVTSSRPLQLWLPTEPFLATPSVWSSTEPLYLQPCSLRSQHHSLPPRVQPIYTFSTQWLPAPTRRWALTTDFACLSLCLHTCSNTQDTEASASAGWVRQNPLQARERGDWHQRCKAGDAEPVTDAGLEMSGPRENRARTCAPLLALKSMQSPLNASPQCQPHSDGLQLPHRPGGL